MLIPCIQTSCNNRWRHFNNEIRLLTQWSEILNLSAISKSFLAQLSSLKLATALRWTFTYCCAQDNHCAHWSSIALEEMSKQHAMKKVSLADIADAATWTSHVVNSKKCSIGFSALQHPILDQLYVALTADIKCVITCFLAGQIGIWMELKSYSKDSPEIPWEQSISSEKIPSNCISWLSSRLSTVLFPLLCPSISSFALLP